MIEQINDVKNTPSNTTTVSSFGTKYCGMENVSFPEPSLAHYWHERSNRVIWLDCQIEEDIVGIARNILYWNHEDEGLLIEQRKPIKIYICSPGGLLIPTLAVCDVILKSKTPVWAINLQEACSAAALIYICCHRRAACERAYFLFHLGSGGTKGTYQQTRAQQEDYNHKIEQMIKLLKERMEITEDKEDSFAQYIEGEWYMYADVNDKSRTDARYYNVITDNIDDLL